MRFFGYFFKNKNAKGKKALFIGNKKRVCLTIYDFELEKFEAFKASLAETRKIKRNIVKNYLK